MYTSKIHLIVGLACMKKHWQKERRKTTQLVDYCFLHLWMWGSPRLVPKLFYGSIVRTCLHAHNTFMEMYLERIQQLDHCASYRLRDYSPKTTDMHRHAVLVNYTSTCLDSAERITTVFRYSFHCGGSSTATTVFAAKMNTSTANVQPWTLPRISLFYIHSDCRFMEGVR